LNEFLQGKFAFSFNYRMQQVVLLLYYEQNQKSVSTFFENNKILILYGS